jgi:DNA-binding NtrC family response regulator
MSKNLEREHKTILLIDDDNDILESTQMVLEMDGYNVITASSGEVGIYMYKEHHPSLVLLDLSMPKTDGFETFSKLIAYDKNVKVVLFTGSLIDEVQLQQAYKNGLLDIILKPASLNELNKIINKYT